jgi:Ca2+-binding EF-hand superfamily protein
VIETWLHAFSSVQFNHVLFPSTQEDLLIMKTHSLRILSLTLASSLMALAAHTAHAEPGAVRERLRAADTNGDGLISRAEAQALPMLANHFDRIDANKDGQISPEELRAARQAMASAKGGKRDGDGDGRISREEAAKMPHLAKKFDALDTNKDGYLTRDEMRAARAEHMKMRFDSIDSDKDGFLSRAEVESRAPMLKEHFNRIDTNGDGKLSPAELQNAKPNRGGPRA